ncbi:MAG: hypothetical protein CMK37_08340 [Porticoccaceae bacterium]|nr:hypothetical protein [Porticoccaceae bacterium]|tara:strand:- start:4274 stop:4606 length:333 start_codon:yes stop_codon:yes gene_type:complete
MNLIIDSSFSEPPSNISCFRDVTLFAKTFVFEDIILECIPGTRTLYWNWLKSHGAYDFISDLIWLGEQESGYRIKTSAPANIVVDRINYHNLDYIISRLQSLKKGFPENP